MDGVAMAVGVAGAGAVSVGVSDGALAGGWVGALVPECFTLPTTAPLSMEWPPMMWFIQDQTLGQVITTPIRGQRKMMPPLRILPQRIPQNLNHQTR